jgi:hypothetical protein
LLFAWTNPNPGIEYLIGKLTIDQEDPLKIKHLRP